MRSRSKMMHPPSNDKKDFLALSEKILSGGQIEAGKIMPPSIQAPLIDFADKLLLAALNQRASDLHIEPHEGHLFIRLRIDGLLQTYLTLPKALQNPLLSRLKLLSKMDIIERRQPQDGSFQFCDGSYRADVRTATMPTLQGEKMVLRLFRQQNKLRTLAELDFTAANLKKFYNLLTHKGGLIINSGPVNSGKSTTLYAALNELCRTDCSIVSLEDPVECRLDEITQIQVNDAIGLTFSRCLRALLRQDPDIIMIGEIRDEEVAQLAIKFALTGRLVLTTLHAENTAKAILRLLQMKIKPHLLDAALIGCLSQRLLRRLCPHCSAPAKAPTKAQIEFCHYHNISLSDDWQGTGCTQCNGSGFLGRIPLHEVLTWSEYKNMNILNKINYSNIPKPKISLLADGVEKIKAHLTNSHELMRFFHHA